MIDQEKVSKLIELGNLANKSNVAEHELLDQVKNYDQAINLSWPDWLAFTSAWKPSDLERFTKGVCFAEMTHRWQVDGPLPCVERSKNRVSQWLQVQLPWDAPLEVSTRYPAASAIWLLRIIEGVRKRSSQRITEWIQQRFPGNQDLWQVREGFISRIALRDVAENTFCVGKVSSTGIRPSHRFAGHRYRLPSPSVWVELHQWLEQAREQENCPFISPVPHPWIPGARWHDSVGSRNEQWSNTLAWAYSFGFLSIVDGLLSQNPRTYRSSAMK